RSSCSPGPLAPRPARPSHLPPSPTRRSSALNDQACTCAMQARSTCVAVRSELPISDGSSANDARTHDGTSVPALAAKHTSALKRDRKSTRLNSSHVSISYAVFCLKKKNDNDN